MLRRRAVSYACFVLAVLALPDRLLADTDPPQPVFDPGFVYVTAMADGSYDPSHSFPVAPTGDPIRDIILTKGTFDAQVTRVGNHAAPTEPVTLVIPASVDLAAPDGSGLPVSVSLSAGMHVIVHGRITAPAITLHAGTTVPATVVSASRSMPASVASREAERDGLSAAGDATVLCHGAQGLGYVDLSGAYCKFATTMKVTAGLNVILDGAMLDGMSLRGTDATGNPYPTTLSVVAGTNAGGDGVRGMWGISYVGQSISLRTPGSITLQGGMYTASDSASTISMTAGTDLLLPADAGAAIVSAEHSVTLDAGAKLDVDQAAVGQSDPLSDLALTLTADGPVALRGLTITTPGKMTIRSYGDSVTMQSAGINGVQTSLTSAYSGISVTAKGACDLVGSSLTATSGAISIASSDRTDLSDNYPIGPATSLLGASVTISGTNAIDATAAAITSVVGAVSISSSAGSVKLDGAAVTGAAGVSATGYTNGNDPLSPLPATLSAKAASLQAGNWVRLTATNGPMDIGGLTVNPTALAPAATYFSAQSPGTMGASGIQVTVPGTASIKSTGDSVHVEGALVSGGAGITVTSGTDLFASAVTDASDQTPTVMPVSLIADKYVHLTATNGSVVADLCKIGAPAGLDGATTAITVQGQGSVSVGSALWNVPGAVSVKSLGGDVCFDGAQVFALGGVYASAAGSLTAARASGTAAAFVADKSVRLYTTTGGIDLSGSTISPPAGLGTATTYVTVQGQGDVAVGGAQWLQVPGTVSVSSKAGRLVLDGATIQALGGIAATGAASPSDPLSATLSAIGATLDGGKYVKTYATAGSMDLGGSSLTAPNPTAVTAVALVAQAQGAVKAVGTTWNTPAKLTITSQSATDPSGSQTFVDISGGNVFASAMSITAFGLDIYLQGLLFNGMALTRSSPVTYGPTGYRLHPLLP